MLFNDGRGGFQARRDHPTGRSPYSVVIGDLDGDGKPDLMTGGFDEETVCVLLNAGDGRFRAKLDFPSPGVPRFLAIADVNGDRRPDLAATIFTWAVVVHLNGSGATASAP